MRKPNQSGSTLSLVLIVVLILALLGAIAFGLWASAGKAENKSDLDKKIAIAVESAKKSQAEELRVAFEQESKNPNKTYQGPVSSGSVSFFYPKTWNAYIVEDSGSQPINGYFHLNQVPGIQSETAFALRLEMLNSDYSQVVTSLSSGYTQKIKDGSVKASAYIPPKMQGVADVQPGTRFDGAIDPKKTGSMVVMKVRDKTLKIYTESTDFLGDFNDIILASLKYSP